jgi:hypothetical protein
VRALVVGAGASIEEAIRAGAPIDLWPPTIENFAKKLWDTPPNSFFNYWLPDYFQAHGIDPGNDPTSRFIDLCGAPQSQINVERLFEFCWVNKGTKFDGDWENLIHHGILNPMTFLLSQAFYKNGVGIKQLQAGQLVAGHLNDGDIVLSLNYETLFEIAATQCGRTLTYAPNTPTNESILVVKPHGSMNLLADERSFWFAQPDCIGALPSSDNNFRSWRAIVPPRFNKSYVQHPIAKRILDSIQSAAPSTLTFWGVGLTDSDTDLMAIYRRWAVTASRIEVVNPGSVVRNKVATFLKKDVLWFSSIEDWLSQS